MSSAGYTRGPVSQPFNVYNSVGREKPMHYSLTSIIVWGGGGGRNGGRNKLHQVSLKSEGK